MTAGCGQNAAHQSTLHAESRQSRQIMTLFWAMLGAATVVFLGTVLLIFLAVRRKKKAGWPLLGENERFSNRLVVTFGIVIPIVCLATLFPFANIDVVRTVDAPTAAQAKMNMTVVGHQWFWEVRYPGTKAVTANEIHIPVKTPVRVKLQTADVIHSFWVPEMNKKVDMIPGRTNYVELYSDHTGVYRGQCAEYCGPQHAHMAMAVYVDTPAKFRAWLANMAKPLAQPATPLAKTGEQVFLTSQCSSCHTIRGTSANGRIGPDLTHLMTRHTLAALTIPNRTGYLGGWVLDPQHIKPGNKMPGLNLTGPQFHALLAFLEGLK